MRKLLIRAVLALLALFGIAIFFYYTPDTDRAEMVSKYSSPASQLVDLKDGFNLHYQLTGPDTAPVLVFLHGSNSSLQTWHPIVRILENEFRCLVIDLPGHGLTGPSPDSDYSVTALHNSLQKLLEALDIERAVWIGNSWGGWISWRMALDHPEKVEGLVLISSSGAISTEEEKLYLGARILRSPAGRALMPHFTPRSMITTSLKHTVHDDTLVTDAMIDRYWELNRFPGNRKAAAIRAITDREVERFHDLAEITTPTLILWGEEDLVSPVSHAHAFKRVIEHARLHTYPNTGHLAQEERAEDVARDITNFVDTLEEPILAQ